MHDLYLSHERFDIRTAGCGPHGRFRIIATALLQWLSKYAVRVYTTSDSAVTYLNHA